MFHQAGELVIILENDRGPGGSNSLHGLLPPHVKVFRVLGFVVHKMMMQAGYHHVMVKTRHGRKIRLPRNLLR